MATFRWWCALDNYEPRRAEMDGTLERSTHAVTGNDTIVILPPLGLKDSTNAVYLIDDGETVTAWYVAGWNPKDPGLILNPFPVNPGGERTRPDNGRPVDYSAWSLGPRRAYHLKVTPA
jgi:hypothetical protein